MKTNILLALFFIYNISFGQIVYSDNMEHIGWTWKGVPRVNTFSSYVGGNAFASDAPSNTSMYNSFDSCFRLVGNGLGSSAIEKDTLFYSNVFLNPGIGYQIKFNVASIALSPATNAAAGVDGTDYVQLAISVDGGTTYRSEMRLNGSNNSYWPFSLNTIIENADNVLSLYSSSTASPISTIKLNLPLGLTQLSMYIIVVVNASGESWLIDDVQLIEVTALPVELIEFKGKYYNTGIKLYWSTASEINNDHFDILKSYNGIDYVKLVSISGKGNSTNVLNYEYIDYDVCDTLVYYKLKQVDYDSRYKEYDPIAFKCRHPFLYDDFFDVLGRKVRQDYDGIKIQQK